ncbi:MAG: biotin/lipoyl-containing protein [Opitutus sp.]
MKKLRVTIEGRTYDVLVEILDEGSPTSVPAAVPAPLSRTNAPAASALTSKSDVIIASVGDITSPLAGKVVSIDVAQGSDVLEGGQVATVEAMKMNTYIFAPKSGRVDRILVNPGDGVEEGSVLLHLA